MRTVINSQQKGLQIQGVKYTEKLPQKTSQLFAKRFDWNRLFEFY